MQTLASLEETLDKKRYFLSVDPTNPNLLAEIADLYVQSGEFEQAELYIEQGLNVEPEHSALNFVKGALAMATDQIDVAIEAFKLLTYDVGTAPEVTYNLAYCYFLKGDALKAQILLAPLVSGQHRYMPAHLLYAKACHHLGEMMDAITHIDDYLFKYPDSDEALGMLALVFLDVEDDQALNYADKALAVNSENSDALLVKATLNLNQFEPDEALDYFQRVNELKPTRGRAGAGLGLIAMAKHDFKTARFHLEGAVANMSNHIGTWHALAWCQLFDGDLMAAKQSFDKSMELDRNFGETFGGLAVISALEGDLDEARILSKKALGLDSESFSARYAQTLIIDGKGDAERAEAMREKILVSDVLEQGSLQSLIIKLQKHNH